jgi:hypothetical protein
LGAVIPTPPAAGRKVSHAMRKPALDSQVETAAGS